MPAATHQMKSSTPSPPIGFHAASPVSARPGSFRHSRLDPYCK
jgi:hypothetical protein